MNNCVGCCSILSVSEVSGNVGGFATLGSGIGLGNQTSTYQ